MRCEFDSVFWLFLSGLDVWERLFFASFMLIIFSYLLMCLFWKCCRHRLNGRCIPHCFELIGCVWKRVSSAKIE